MNPQLDYERSQNMKGEGHSEIRDQGERKEDSSDWGKKDDYEGDNDNRQIEEN